MKVSQVVFDSNILISATIAPKGRPALCLFWVLSQGGLIVSSELLDEFETRLERPKFAKYATQDERRAMVATVRRAARNVSISGSLNVGRDPDDNKILETALIGQADYIVTGDKDPLVLHPFRGIKILGPFDFLRAVAGPTP